MTRQAVPRRAQGQHAGLTRTVLLDTAMELVDREGLARLSMRRLAAELGVQAMTLYHHVGTKDELLDGLVERLLEAAVPELPDDGTWQDSLRALALGLRAQLLAHPHLVPVVATRPAVTPSTLRTLELALETLSPAGFAPVRGLEMVYAVVGLVLGQLSVEVAAGDTSVAERLQRLDEADLDGLPLLQEAVTQAPSREPRSVFDLSLDALIDGLAGRP